MGVSACVFILEAAENHFQFWSMLDSTGCRPWRPEQSSGCVSLSEARDKILHVMQQQRKVELGSLASLRTYRHLKAKVGTFKGGGKQWQTTPKYLPRMQCARAIPVT